MSNPTGGPGRVVAFVSAASGTGCTSTAANLACALAGTGRRVLIVDWGSDTPRVREYLEPFQAGTFDLVGPLAEVLVAGRLGAGDTPTVSRFQLPGGEVDVLAMVDDDGAELFPVASQDPVAVTALRNQLPRAGYDQVLIDAPTGGPERTLESVATLCEAAVVCFRPRPRAIQDAATLGARVRRHAPIGIDVVAVATAFDDSYPPRTDRIRDAIRAAFADLPRGPGAIEIPNRPFETFDPLLAIMVEEPAPPGEEPSALHAGYWQLAAAVADVDPAELSPVTAGFRARYRRVFGLAAPADPNLVLVAYTPQDRPWSDWVTARLQRAGARTGTLAEHRATIDPANPPGLVVVSSTAFDESAELTMVTELLAEAEAAGAHVDVLRVVVDGEGVAPADAANVTSTAVHGSEPALVTKLLGHFELIDRPSTEVTQEMRRPGDRPGVFTVPPRHPHFVGRDEDMERLRDRFAGRAETRAVLTVGGVPGVGKSELALEYAHRFAGDYDLVWWVPSGDEQSVLVSLAQLAARLDPAGSTNFGTTAGLERLADHADYRRFLLIYDNVADQSDLRELLPARRGHVIITSSEAAAADIELAAMTEAESVALLGKRVSGISADDAVRAAGAAHHLPIAVELAGAWLAATALGERSAGASVADAAAWAVRSFLDRLEQSGTRETATGWQADVSRVVAVVTETLRETPPGRIAVAVAELAAFLSQDGISLDLVRSNAMFQQVIAVCGPEANRLLVDAWEMDRALWQGVRYGLFRVDWGAQNLLRVHRIVQTAVRDALPSRARDERRGATLAALAAFAPTEVEENTAVAPERFGELQKHVFPSGAVDSDDAAVRRWLVNQVRFLFTRGGSGVHRAALGPTQKLLDDWTSRYGAGDQMRLRLAVQLANLHRALGDHQQALRLDGAALAEHRRSLPHNHPQTLISARGRGGDLRGLGLFADALEEDRATWEGLREAFGDDHRQTQMAANNLASSLFLSGDPYGALTVADGNHRRKLRLYGEHDPTTWTTLAQVGVYRRELGQYDDALKVLSEAREHLQQPGLHRRELAVRWHQAIAIRCQGRALVAKERTGQALRDFRLLIGPDHPNTLACMVSFAAAHRAVGAEPAQTLDVATRALRLLRERTGLPADHPFLALGELGVGLAAVAAGDRGTANTGAAHELLRDRLGDVHPWTLAAAVNHARALAAAGSAGASALLETTYEESVEFLGADHPHTRITAHNLRVAAGEGEWREIDVDIPET